MSSSSKIITHLILKKNLSFLMYRDCKFLLGDYLHILQLIKLPFTTFYWYRIKFMLHKLVLHFVVYIGPSKTINTNIIFSKFTFVDYDRDKLFNIISYIQHQVDIIYLFNLFFSWRFRPLLLGLLRIGRHCLFDVIWRHLHCFCSVHLCADVA